MIYYQKHGRFCENKYDPESGFITNENSSIMDLNNSHLLPIVDILEKFRFEEKTAATASLLIST